MSLILDRCPFYEQATEVEMSTGPVLVRAYQIVVWVGVLHRGELSRPFPAILDTGHSHNFSIRAEHLESWAGMRATEIKTIGHARVNKQIVELKDAVIAVFPNTREVHDARLDVQPLVLSLPEGIAIHREGDPFAPRLPLLGLRTLVKNRLMLRIDAGRKEVSIERD